MILKFDLPAAVTAAAGVDNEDIYYAVPYDITSAGIYQKDAYVIVTKKRLVVVENGVLKKEYELSDLSDIKNDAVLK